MQDENKVTPEETPTDTVKLEVKEVADEIVADAPVETTTDNPEAPKTE